MSVDVELILKRDSIDDVPSCTKCGTAIKGERGYDWAIHHRRRRDGKPDQDSAQNNVLLCGGSNVDRCHGWAHGRRSESQPEGFWLSRVSGENPLYLPLLLRGARWVYLTASGEYADNPPEVS